MNTKTETFAEQFDFLNPDLSYCVLLKPGRIAHFNAQADGNWLLTFGAELKGLSILPYGKALKVINEALEQGLEITVTDPAKKITLLFTKPPFPSPEPQINECNPSSHFEIPPSAS